LGISLSPIIHVDRSIAVVLAFLLGLGVGAHSLDESVGNPLNTRFSRRTLYAFGTLGLGSAIGIGIYYTLTVSLLLAFFIIAEGFFAIAYNLEVLKGKFHSSLVFALSWGSIPLLAGFFVNSLAITPPAILMAVVAGLLTLVQRTLSFQVRTMRRSRPPLKGLMFDDGVVMPTSTLELIRPTERSLKLLVFSVFLLAISLLLSRIF
jgi:hypothetical protein